MIFLIFIKSGFYWCIFKASNIKKSDAKISFVVSGDDPIKYFQYECGGHRYQRVPPTEKKGRRHTSSVTVSVVDYTNIQAIEVNKKDLKWRFTKGSGPGGQRKNKVATKVILTHIPTNTIVNIDGRSRKKNEEEALRALKNRLFEIQKGKLLLESSQLKKEQVGSGMRGDKRRTIAFHRNEVQDHILGITIPLYEYLSGNFFKLYKN